MVPIMELYIIAKILNHSNSQLRLDANLEIPFMELKKNDQIYYLRTINEFIYIIITFPNLYIINNNIQIFLYIIYNM